MNICSVSDCARPSQSKGLCKKHYLHFRKYGTTELLTPEKRFWAKVEKTDCCWLWRGASDGRAGYGRLTINGRPRKAHHVALELVGVTIPEGMVVMHTCDNPPCVNPAHLRVGTLSDNTRDMFAKGRNFQWHGGPIPRKRDD